MGLKVFIITAALGSAAGWYIYTILKKHTIGELWGAIVVGIIGAYIGTFLIRELIEKINKLTDINILYPLLGASLLVWVFSKVSPGTHKSKIR